MALADHIEALLRALPGEPQAPAEIAARLTGCSVDTVEAVCIALRAAGRLGRNGAGTTSRPYRFYLKNHVRAQTEKALS